LIRNISKYASVLLPVQEHGGDGKMLASYLGIDPMTVLDLSASLNPFAPDVAVLLSKHLDSVKSYPDATISTMAVHRLAQVMGVDEERVLLTNGGAEAIALVAQELEIGDVQQPEFSLYERHLEKVVPGAPLFRSNPNNPTGRLAPPNASAYLWDEAFYPLATGKWTRGDADKGAVVVGSLTKVFACPGLRIGYLIAPEEEMVRRLFKKQPQWSVNSLALSILPELLDQAELEEWTHAIATVRAEMTRLLVSHGLSVQPSDANYIVVKKVAGLREGLAMQGIMVRDCTSFGMPSWLRIAVPDWNGLERLASALDLMSSQLEDLDGVDPV